jgi:hypothetical protein
MTTPPEGTAGPDPRLRMFSLLLAAASLTHMASFPWWMGLLSGQVVLAATLVAAILTAAIASVWQLRWAGAATTEQRPRPVASIAFEQAQPLIIAELVVMYLFTVLHKLNDDFLNPAVSCAVSMHHELAEVVPWVPDGEWTWWPTILGTLAVELAMPLLGYQDDLVEVLKANDPRLAGLARSGDLLPWFEFRRIASSTRPGTVIHCRRNGQEMTLSRDDDSAASREAFTPHPWWMAKLLVFRPIRPFGEPMTCRH